MKDCVVCGKEITWKRSLDPRRKFCASKCYKKHIKEQRAKLNPLDPIPLPSSVVGTIHELLAIVDLMRKGYEIYKSVNPAAHCDLAVLKDGVLKKIEVTTGYKSIGGKLIYPPKLKAKFDVLAVVCRDGGINYFPTEF